MFSSNLKLLQQKKIRLRVYTYSIGEYFYILSKNGLTLWDRTYTINQDDEDLLEWEKGLEEDCNL